jgi:hypothetical protein
LSKGFAAHPWLLDEGLVECVVEIVENDFVIDIRFKWDGEHETDVVEGWDEV